MVDVAKWCAWGGGGAAVKLTQQGFLSDGFYQSVDVPIAAVDPAYSVVLVSYGVFDLANRTIGGRILNATTLRLERNTTDNVYSIGWQVIEYEPSAVKSFTIANGQGSANVALPNVDLSKTQFYINEYQYSVNNWPKAHGPSIRNNVGANPTSTNISLLAGASDRLSYWNLYAVETL